MAFDQKHRVARKWEATRRKFMHRDQSKGLTGAALDAAVMALAMSDPSLVKFEDRGAAAAGAQ